MALGGGVGGYSATSDLALGKKVGNLDFLGFGGGGILKLKSHKVARSKVQFSWGGYSETQVKVPRSLTIFGGGGILKLTCYSVWVQ